MKTLNKITSLLTRLSNKNYFPISMRIFSLLLFILFIIALVLGSVKILTYDFTNKATMFIVWILWWPFLYITLFFFARIWCGVLCPLSLANQLGNMIHKGKGINYRKWAFVPFVLFFVIVYIEQTSGLFLSTSVTLWFFVLSFITAFVMGILFLRFSFCKLICPIGVILGVFSRISMIGLRTKKEICDKCPKKTCILGGRTNPCPVFLNVPAIKSNRDCLMCMNCIKNCPYDSAHIGVVSPGKEIMEKRDFILSESYFIICLLGLATVLTTNGTSLFRKILTVFSITLSGSILRLVDFVLGLGLFIIIFSVVGYVSAKSMNVKPKEFLSELGYYYLPIVFFIMFYTISFGFLGPWLPISDGIISLIKYIFLIVGAIWSAYIIVKISLPKINAKLARCAMISFLLLIFTLFAGVLIQDPLNVVAQPDKTVFAHQGEVIHMESFSMGFDPNIIVVEKGTEVVLFVDNIDIMHAFDLAEFDVHYVLFPAEKLEIRFTPDKTGEFEFTCSIPGHTEAGMKGKLIVVDVLTEDDETGFTVT
ncbi:hypothetical protein COV16_05255 [Candidatus Woesearchaeota archaeon CG10_big_fil_rev_8_21_14_0_10_34_8]|nr:MAG: hypothetical protein COV16_05255 [Candidatus Woesearchaeota archaeon CG10_big_fil_rev_8_21_14_0_10_34_8]